MCRDHLVDDRRPAPARMHHLSRTIVDRYSARSGLGDNPGSTKAEAALVSGLADRKGETTSVPVVFSPSCRLFRRA